MNSSPHSSTFMRRAFGAASVSMAVLLAACGGGGGGGGDDDDGGRFPPSSQFAGVCTADDQKQFVRSYLDEIYLWYDEIREVDRNAYATPDDYFKALLVPKDRYWDNSSTYSGVRRTSQVGPGAPVPSTNGALRAVAGDFVPLYNVVQSPNGRRVGYVLLREFEIGAQDQLITAFADLKSQNVQDVVLDLRDNPGGYLYVAQTAASLVTSPQADGRVFERLRYNNKRQSEANASTFFFSNRVQTAETRYPKDTPLPQLSLPRAYVLTSTDTCSASESVINSLRGIDVEVVQIGAYNEDLKSANTCGKPFGFRRRDNCGLSYYAVEFQGYNAKGFGDYQGGFAPQCQVQDDVNTLQGSPTADPLLVAALRHADTGACPAGTATGAPSKSSLQQELLRSVAAADGGTSSPLRPARRTARTVFDGRLLLPSSPATTP